MTFIDGKRTDEDADLDLAVGRLGVVVPDLPVAYLADDDLRAARLNVTSHAKDATDARELLAALGLIEQPVPDAGAANPKGNTHV